MDTRTILDGDFGGLLPDIPLWVKKSIAAKARSGKLTVVSAVCPDYERKSGNFTYNSVGGGVPYIANQHLDVVEVLFSRLRDVGILLDYHVALADTECDLPSVMRKLVGGDADRFTALCQSSCTAITEEARKRQLPLVSCRRFLDVFPEWLTTYRSMVKAVEEEVRTNTSVSADVAMNAAKRYPLYAAMAGEPVTNEYCTGMAIRQLAQYATWGKLAEKAFGEGVVMINHTTPNLSRVNHPLAREGRARIPILKLALSTVPH